jgi:DNA-binding SARP family transcriptional activator
MLIRLLGNLDVRVGDRRIKITRNRARAVLALLALGVPVGVPVERMIDAIWGTAPPRHARNQVQIHVSKLRHLLEEAGASRDDIETTTDGYRLALATDPTDIARFDLLCCRAAGIARRNRPAAARLLWQALDLWRGETLSDVDAPFAQQLRTDLRERRRAATIRLADLELSLRRYTEILPSLHHWIRDDPYDEAVRLRLMLGLRGDGRPAEALALYRDTRRLFAQDLGIEPGDGLRTAHQRILNNEPFLFGVGDTFDNCA